MAIAATIQAAEIQASATKIAAIYGGLALGVGVFASWLTSLHLQKVARLAETRRDVYLELVESYSLMITGFQLLLSDLEKHWEAQQTLILNFSKAVDKTAFICETKTKEEILNFLENFGEKIQELHAEINPLIVRKGEIDNLFNRHSRAMELFNNAAMEMERIKIHGDGEDRIPHISKYFDEKLEESAVCIKNMNEIADDIKTKSASIKPLLTTLINESNANANLIVHLLRKELGAKTDIELDKKLQTKLAID
jgi:hypothetical protein